VQAEDGIRDRNVTGVQTCALPIFNYIRKAGGSVAVNRYSLTVPQNFDFAANQDFLIPCTVREAAGKNFIPELVITLKKRALLWRSEERRVGNEDGVRWIAGDDEEK